MKRTTDRIAKDAKSGLEAGGLPCKSVNVLQNDNTGTTVIAFEVDLSKLRMMAPQRLRTLKCSECGEDRDCRPIGSKGAEICYECACKNDKRSKHNWVVYKTGKGKCR